MNILFSINHPAHVHFFRNSIVHLQSLGYNIVIVSRDKDITTKLLDLYSLPYIKLTSEKSGIVGVLSELIMYQVKVHQILSKYKINLALSIGGTFIAQACYILRIPLIVFTDTEFNFSNKLSFPFAKIIATPTCYKGNLGSRQIRYNGFHELAYLHPSHFKADKKVLYEIGIKDDEKFFLVRKTSGKAVENIGQVLLNNDELIDLVKYLERIGRVILSIEGEIPSILERNVISVKPNKIHSLLYYAHLFVGDSLTMFTESALLGTPSISISSEGFLLGNFDEICNRYELGFRFKSLKHASEKIKVLLDRDGIKNDWLIKREKLLAEKVDVTQFQLDLIDSLINKKRVT